MDKDTTVRKKKRARASKDKGLPFQKEVLDILLSALPHLEGQLQTAYASIPGEDIIPSTLEAREALFNLTIECKRQETLSVPAWIRQAESAIPKSPGAKYPCVVFRQNHRPAYAIIPLTVLAQLLRESYEYRRRDEREKAMSLPEVIKLLEHVATMSKQEVKEKLYD